VRVTEWVFYINTMEDGVTDFSGEAADSFLLNRDRNHRRSAGSVIFDLSTTVVWYSIWARLERGFRFYSKWNLV